MHYLKVVIEEVTKAALSNAVLHNCDSQSMGKIEIDKYGLQQCFSMKSSQVFIISVTFQFIELC
jgi:hypothetical protein